MGVPQNIMRALCAVMQPDHFKFASYGPEVSFITSVCLFGSARNSRQNVE